MVSSLVIIIKKKVAILKKVLESNLTLNLLASALAISLAIFFWADLTNSLPTSFLNTITKLVVMIIAGVSIYLIWLRSFPTLPILYLVFSGCYFLYQLMFSQSRPIWLVLVLLFALLWLTFPIFQVKEKHGIYFFLLVLVLFEVFLSLAYWLVNPLTRSLIMAIAAYIYGGWLLKVQGGKEKLSNYYWYACIAFFIALLSMRWGM